MLLAAAAAGCSNTAQVFEDNNDGGLFSKPINVFAKPEWSTSATGDEVVNLGPKGPVGPEDLVSADGRCAPPVVADVPQAPGQPAQVADRPVGSMAGDLAGAPMPAAPQASLEPSATVVMGGIALGMTECQAVRRAGLPSNVAISAGDKGARKVVLTYLGGTWPGIYNFESGRLKEISRAPEPVKPASKKRSKRSSKRR